MAVIAGSPYIPVILPIPVYYSLLDILTLCLAFGYHCLKFNGVNPQSLWFLSCFLNKLIQVSVRDVYITCCWCFHAVTKPQSGCVSPPS